MTKEEYQAWVEAYFLEAYGGKVKPTVCDIIPLHYIPTCQTCLGTGKITRVVVKKEMWIKCLTCGGNGRRKE